jgi:pimeloyl-ACP methyl ester carboxylesterase
MQILLIHGMGRTPLSMRRLARDLRRAGHGVHQLGYSAALEPLDQIAARVRKHLDTLGRDGTPVVSIGHSLGGVLVRMALAIDPSLACPPRHLIMIGPPNRSPRLARRLHRFWPYRWVNGEAGQRLADPSFLAGLPAPPVPYTIIAGTGGRRGRWSVFGDEPNDGLVGREETRCTDEDRVLEVPARHTFIMNHPEVRRIIHAVVGAIDG